MDRELIKEEQAMTSLLSLICAMTIADSSDEPMLFNGVNLNCWKICDTNSKQSSDMN